MPEIKTYRKPKRRKRNPACPRNRAKKDLGPALEEIEVKDVRIGLAYTGVLLSENYGGVACTPLYEFSGCPALGFAGFLKGTLRIKCSSLPVEKPV